VRVHLDTDVAGDPDDVAALAYLLARKDVELVGVTTVDDPGGRRAGYAAEVLRLAGHGDVPVAAGAEVSLTTGRSSGGAPPGPPYWPVEVPPRPGQVDAALDLLARSVAAGAVVVGIGPATTLAMLERHSAGALAAAHVVLMGGFVDPPGEGLPQWRAEDDWNVTCDPVAATEVRRAAGRLTVVPLAVTAQVHLRDRDLPRLRAAGPLGRLMAAQAEVYRDELGKRELGRAHAGLPDDLANFHHDPLTAAVATGWPGVAVETVGLRPVPGDPVARLERSAASDPATRLVELVVGVDGPAYGDHWLSTVEALPRG
jgi:purine nucleosidase